jgi:hypothetical protein
MPTRTFWNRNRYCKRSPITTGSSKTWNVMPHAAVRTSRRTSHVETRQRVPHHGECQYRTRNAKRASQPTILALVISFSSEQTILILAVILPGDSSILSIATYGTNITNGLAVSDTMQANRMVCGTRNVGCEANAANGAFRNPNRGKELRVMHSRRSRTTFGIIVHVRLNASSDETLHWVSSPWSSCG